MSKYSTGEMAKLCDVSVRTVQFYDTKDILKPTELSEGGRRLYAEADIDKLHLICLLRSLGLSLDSIKGILQSKTPSKILTLLLDEQTKQISSEISEKKKQLKAIGLVKESLENTTTIPVNSITDIDSMMNGRNKLKKTYAVMLTVGIVLDIVQLGALLLWILKGIWWPFAAVMPLMLVAAALLVKSYYANTAYICSDCKAKFKPRFKEFFFSKHTPKTRKLTCTKCGYQDWCVETYPDEVQK